MASPLETRKRELLGECEIDPKIFGRVLPRLKTFLKPFVNAFVRKEQVDHAQTLIQGLLSDVEHKNAVSFDREKGSVPARALPIEEWST